MQMIPNVLGNEVKSKAEKKVFEWLKASKIDGFAFHSVGLPEHVNKSYSEADYIVVTAKGVLCLEIKGGRVSCENGIWQFTNQYEEVNIKREGPYEQAVGALFALKSALIKRLPNIDFNSISFATGVVFPDIVFDYPGVSVIYDITLDKSYEKSFACFIDDCHTYWDKRNRRQYIPLTDTIIEQIRCAIRDDLCFVPSLQAISDATDDELVRLTAEQCEVLDALYDNAKVLVNGPAGSGKTILAKNFAKKCASKGKRVIFLTYNKTLALYLSRKSDDGNIVIKHFHGLLAEYVSVADVSLYNFHDYFNNILPNRFLKYTESHRMLQYDVLVVDEGQDLIKNTNLRIFDKLIKGGLFRGEWAIFYDANQNIFNSKLDKCFEEINKYYPTKVRLTKNCRNSFPIAKFNCLVSGIDSGKTLVDGESVEVLLYGDDESFNNRLSTLLAKLRDGKVSNQDIVILSPVSYENSILSRINCQYPVTKDLFDSTDTIKYATIQSFKGLDSKIVIMIDAENMFSREMVRMAYTMISRARTLLYLLLPNSIGIAVQSKVIDSISNERGQ